MIPEKEWEWFGLSGHFICGQWCRFHMATKVGEYWISTVGLMVSPSNSGGSEQTERKYLKNNPLGDDIGCNRKFETMVFKVSGVCSCGCGQPTFNPTQIDFEGYNETEEAREGHMKMCYKYAKEQK